MATYVGEMRYLIIGDKEYSLPTGGGGSGTVTSVAVSNATNGGMSISGSPITSSGAITIGHSNVLASAQTTQAVYPIKIDKNGHISAYGSAVTIPTKTSDLANDSGFITSYTDTKNTAGSTNSTSKLYLIGATEQSANPQTYSNDGLYINNEGTLITQSFASYGSVGFSPGTSEYTFDNSYFNLSTKVYTQEDVSDSVRGAFIGGDYTGLTLGSYKGNNYSDITTYLRVSSEDETIEITNLSTPSNNTDAATKKYVDDSVGAITVTDEKLAVSEAYINASYNVLLGYGESAQTRQLDGGLSYQRTSGTPATANLYIGSGGHSSGNLILEDGISHYTTINTDTQTANRIITLPDKTGTVALTSDIPSVPTITLNGSSTTTPSFYAATGAGTSGQYLKSSGSGAPTWETFPTIPTISLNGSTTTSPSFYAPTGAGSSGQYLKSNGSGAPIWTNFPTIPSITLNGSSTTSPSFYAPTSAGTSGYVLKSNGSGAPTWTSATLTDEKLRVYALNTTTQTGYNLVLSNNSSSAETKYVTNGLQITHNDGSATVEGNAILKIGTNVAKGTAGNQTGKINLYGDTAYRIELKAGSPTSHQIIAFPDKSGTIALTSDIPSVPTITLNGSSTTSPSFYAPTSTGTNGYYLKSNGSGAPTWSSIDPTYLSNGSASIVLYNLSYGHRMIKGFTVAQSDTNDTCELSIGGNASGEGTGLISLHTGDTNYSTTLVPDSSLSADRTITLPDKTGTVALTSDIPITDVTVGGTSVVTSGVAAIASPVQIVRW